MAKLSKINSIDLDRIKKLDLFSIPLSFVCDRAQRSSIQNSSRSLHPPKTRYHGQRLFDTFKIHGEGKSTATNKFFLNHRETPNRAVFNKYTVSRSLSNQELRLPFHLLRPPEYVTYNQT